MYFNEQGGKKDLYLIQKKKKNLYVVLSRYNNEMPLLVVVYKLEYFILFLFKATKKRRYSIK